MTDESPQPRPNVYFDLLVMTILGAGGLLGMTGILILAGLKIEVPQAAVAIVSSCFGSLGSILLHPPRIANERRGGN